MNVRYLFALGELEGGGKRATDPNWQNSADALVIFTWIYENIAPRNWAHFDTF